MANLKVEHIYKSFDGNKVLKDINIEIQEGELVSLLGPSGCGKTTLLKVIAGLELPDEGKVFFDGEDYTKLESNKRNALIVFQDYGLFPHMTIEENIGFGLKVRGVNKIERKKRIVEMLDLIQLQDKGKNYPHELSGGQKQRVALARAVIVQPKILLLDEPFSNLDTNLKETMRDFVLHIQSKVKITTILVTHDKEEAFMMSQKVAVIMDGEINQYGSPREVYNAPATRQVSDFIGEANYIQGKIIDGVFISNIGNYNTPIDNKDIAYLLIRYNEIELTKETSEIKCIVLDRKYAGKNTVYKVSINDDSILTLTSNNSNFQVGDKGFLKFNLKAINIY